MTDWTQDEVYSYHGPRKDMNLNSIEERLEDVVPYGPNNIRSYLEWLWPKNDDGSRQVDDHTIMTAEAWIKMLEDAKDKVALSIPKTPVYPPWYLDVLEKLSVVEERESLAASQRRDHPMYFIGGRRNGHTHLIHEIDEWHDHMYPPKIDINRLNDPDYIRELRESVNERLEQDGHI